jgi:hypothetical protein
MVQVGFIVKQVKEGGTSLSTENAAVCMAHLRGIAVGCLVEIVFARAVVPALPMGWALKPPKLAAPATHHRARNVPRANV